jgi:predicted nucleotidyltransferase
MTVTFERDADDLRLIMQHYLDAGNKDRIYSEQGDCSHLLNEEFDHERASARILGHDVGRLLTATSQLGANAFAMAMIRKEGRYYGDSDSAIARLVEVQKGVSETRRS